MRITYKRDEIAQIKADRYPTNLEIPEHFRDNSLGLRPDRKYGILHSAKFHGISSFENAPVEINMSPSKITRFRFGSETYNVDPALCQKGQHNIQLGPVKIVEHPLSLLTGLGADFHIEINQPSFPTFDYCNKPYLDAMKGNIVDLGPARFFTVQEPVAVQFEKGYCILEPDDGSQRIEIDHQVQYPGSSIGTTRIKATLTPEFYAFLCAARTPSFRTRLENKKNYEIVKSGVPTGYPITIENVLFVDEEEFYNPRSEFVHDGINFEFMFHEIIDIIAWIKFLEVKEQGRFAGKMTTFLFDHHSQIDMALFACRELKTR